MDSFWTNIALFETKGIMPRLSPIQRFDNIEYQYCQFGKSDSYPSLAPLFTFFHLSSDIIIISPWQNQESPISYTLPTLRITEKDPVRAESPDVKEVMDSSESTESTWSVNHSANEQLIWDSRSTVKQSTCLIEYNKSWEISLSFLTDLSRHDDYILLCIGSSSYTIIWGSRDWEK